ncbi:hypothetical protein IWX50DRAFT_251061 [Phyllosticta citricarpa]
MTVPWMHSGSCRTRSALVSAKLFLQLSISSPISQERIKSLLIYPPIPFSQPLPSTCLFLPFRSARRTFTRPTHSPSIASMYVYSTPARHHRRRRHQPRPFLCTTPCRTSHMAKFAESQSISPVSAQKGARADRHADMHVIPYRIQQACLVSASVRPFGSARPRDATHVCGPRWYVVVHDGVVIWLAGWLVRWTWVVVGRVGMCGGPCCD